jgi:hypothetical protein
VETSIIYTSVFVGEILLMLLLSKILNVGTEDTWLGAVGVSVVFITGSIVLIDIARKLWKTHLAWACLLYFFAFGWLVATIISNLVFFIN